MVTVGKTSTGRPICKILKPDGYFETYNDAYAALVEYNRNPYDLEPAMLMKELFDRWFAEYQPTLRSESSVRTITSAWAYCTGIYDMRVMDVRARHIKGVIDNGCIEQPDGSLKYPTAGVKGRIKSVFNLMLDYAVEYELTDRNYARTFNLSDDIIKEKERSRRAHIPFTDEEMHKLWEAKDIKHVDCVLIQCYMGWRPQELCLLELENINFDDWTIRGGMKTEAGENRLVPIHPRIRDLVLSKYQEAVSLGSRYLINCTDAKTHSASGYIMTYDKYQQRFCRIRDGLGLNPEHRAHDCRVQFVTQCKKYKVDEYCIKYMVGHTIDDITEAVYTHREVEWFQSEISKIP